MRQVYSIDFEADEIDKIRNFIKFHAKRLKCSEAEVFKKLSDEFEESLKIVDYQAEKAKAEAEASETPVPKGLPFPTRGIVRNERSDRANRKPGRPAKKSRAKA